MIPRDIFIRNIHSESLVETFLVAAVSAIFSIRFILFVTGYPQIGRGGVHIAHMLWGGFFMLIGIILLLSFLNKTLTWGAAILGGIGFGIFIDELGKFITSDNNYFFRPTVALIYVIFTILFFLSKSIPKYKAFSQKEYLINAIDMMKEAVINDMDIEEEELARQYLNNCDKNDPIVQSLLLLLTQIDAVEKKNPGPIARVRKYIRKIYHRFAAIHIVTILVILVQVIQAITAIGFVIFVSYTRLSLTFDQWGVLFTTVLSAFFVFYGTVSLRRGKVQAFRQYRMAVLVSIFLTQFFLFYNAQFYALTVLFFNLGMLLVIDYTLTVEQRGAHKHVTT